MRLSVAEIRLHISVFARGVGWLHEHRDLRDRPRFGSLARGYAEPSPSEASVVDGLSAAVGVLSDVSGHARADLSDMERARTRDAVLTMLNVRFCADGGSASCTRC